MVYCTVNQRDIRTALEEKVRNQLNGHLTSTTKFRTSWSLMLGLTCEHAILNSRTVRVPSPLRSNRRNACSNRARSCDGRQEHIVRLGMVSGQYQNCYEIQTDPKLQNTEQNVPERPNFHKLSFVICRPIKRYYKYKIIVNNIMRTRTNCYTNCRTYRTTAGNYHKTYNYVIQILVSCH